MHNLSIKIFFQLILEPLPISSSAQLEIISFFLDNEILQKPEKLIIQLFNFISDIVIFLFFYRHSSIFKKSIKIKHILTFTKLFFFSGIANFFTMIIFLQQKKVLAVLEIPLFPKLYINFIISFFLIASNFFKETYWNTKKELEQSPSMPIAVALGLCQGISTLQGISRLGITFVSARWLNLSPKNALFFSWLMHFQISVLYIFKFFKYKSIESILLLFSAKETLLILSGILLSYHIFKLTYNLAIQKQFYLFSAVQLIMVLSMTIYFLWGLK